MHFINRSCLGNGQCRFYCIIIIANLCNINEIIKFLILVLPLPGSELPKYLEVFKTFSYWGIMRKIFLFFFTIPDLSFNYFS